MRKRVLLIVGALAAALSVSIGAVAVMAQVSSSDRHTDGTTITIQSLVSRVAEILDEDEDTVQAAFDQARDDMRGDLKAAHRAALEERLDAAVEDGDITQEEADEYLEWYDSAPDDLGIGGMKGRHYGGFGFGHHRG